MNVERRIDGRLSRRGAIKAMATAVAGISISARETYGAAASNSARGVAKRSYHVCLSPEIIEAQPELLQVVASAGVETVWVAGYFYGFRPYPGALIAKARTLVQRAGLKSEAITVPLGHPGDSLGSSDGGFPLTPPKHWRLGQRVDGVQYAGTSLHAPATEENCEGLRWLRTLGFRKAFLDDDFRLARGPGEIGGCFCSWHQQEFLRASGETAARWEELLADVKARRFTPLLRRWIDWTCDQFKASFLAQQQAFQGELGFMAMYLGSEKAGMRLSDYPKSPLRVGELMFDDGSFGRVKGKTDELFSVLGHRRFIRPELAYSETTAYPANRLSGAHLAAKLTVSTIADVRHTMFMSGLTPFPKEHWAVIGPAMREQTRMHEAVAGHNLSGPFHLIWGEAQRYVGTDKPFSLWLALGVPFSVPKEPSAGWNFLSEYDAVGMAEQKAESNPKTRFVVVAGEATSTSAAPKGAERVAEDLAALFAWRRSIREQLKDVPVVEEETPVIAAWYPTAGRLLLWNLETSAKRLTVSYGGEKRGVDVGSLGSVMLEGFGPVKRSAR